MIGFLLKGIFRDRSRSLFPVIVIACGVAITVIMHAWVAGASGDIIRMNAVMQTGHIKVMSQAYNERRDQNPNDLALFQADSLVKKLTADFPEFFWTPRIRFGGLLDIPDENGETLNQGPAMGLAVRLLNRPAAGPDEIELLNVEQALVRGRLPENPNEILISEEFSQKLQIGPGQIATLLSATMYGSPASHNFVVAGTVHFGVSAMDRGAIIADIADIQTALDMQDATAEILGFQRQMQFEQRQIAETVAAINKTYTDADDEFSPVAITLLQQNGLGDLMQTYDAAIFIFIGVFVFVMFMVLWNVGLMGSIRRYGEIGVRLAIGEDKGHLYRSMLTESFLIGLIGSAFGTVLGLIFAYYLQNHGIDISYATKNASMLISNVLHAQVQTGTYVIGFLPGLGATLLGTSVSGIGIYKRETSQLFKELEV